MHLVLLVTARCAASDVLHLSHHTLSDVAMTAFEGGSRVLHVRHVVTMHLTHFHYSSLRFAWSVSTESVTQSDTI